MTGQREMSRTELMTLRFHLHCVASLLPYALRNAALETWLVADGAVFTVGFDPPDAVLEPVVEQGGTALRAALAGRVRSGRVQHELIDLDEPASAAALIDNPSLGYEPQCRLRLRNPSTVANGRTHHAGYLRRALLSADPDLAAAALVDRRTSPGAAPRATDRAAAWATVHRHGGTARVRAVAAALPLAVGPVVDPAVDPVSAEVVAACAQAVPEPFLDTLVEHHLGTGALLRSLRAASTHDDHVRTRGEMRAVLAEPYRIDWALVAAARLGDGIPREAVRLLGQHPDCPPDVATVLITGRPALPGRPLLRRPEPTPPWWERGVGAADTAHDAAGQQSRRADTRPHQRGDRERPAVGVRSGGAGTSGVPPHLLGRPGLRPRGSVPRHMERPGGSPRGDRRAAGALGERLGERRRPHRSVVGVAYPDPALSRIAARTARRRHGGGPGLT
ncbi:hypothetical protein ACFT9I_23160 [Streptomyces sp. NPDC057137]|uniref:hypothetical protein n=1 Tax=Streptomyces sp. NPDC057137 TaxID=3346030 RepID=UPI0036291B48